MSILVVERPRTRDGGWARSNTRVLFLKLAITLEEHREVQNIFATLASAVYRKRHGKKHRSPY